MSGLEELRADDVTDAVGNEAQGVENDLLGVSSSVLGDKSERHDIRTKIKEADVQSSKSSMKSTERQGIEENSGDHPDNEAENDRNATDVVARMISSDD